MADWASKLPIVEKSSGKILWKPYLLGGATVGTLALFVLAWAFSTFPGDRGALEGLQDNQTGWLDTAALNISRLGGWVVAGGMMATAVVALALLRRRADALIMLLGAIPVVLGVLLKEVIGRSRPDLFIIGLEPSSMSFPSGHSLFAMIFGGLLIYIVGEMVGSVKIRRAIQVALVLVILAIGASRVYLGVHWPSDVVGGYLFGVLAVQGLIWLRGRLALGESGLFRQSA